MQNFTERMRPLIHSCGLVEKVGQKKRKTMMWRPSCKMCFAADREFAGKSCLDVSLK